VRSIAGRSCPTTAPLERRRILSMATYFA